MTEYQPSNVFGPIFELITDAWYTGTSHEAYDLMREVEEKQLPVVAAFDCISKSMKLNVKVRNRSPRRLKQFHTIIGEMCVSITDHLGEEKAYQQDRTEPLCPGQRRVVRESKTSTMSLISRETAHA